ncbi:MAG: hypothetical protein ACM3Q2_09930 [Syntrophothermus sp.]
MKYIKIKCLSIFVLQFIIMSAAVSAQDLMKVLAKEKVYHSNGRRSFTDWKEFNTRTVDDLKLYQKAPDTLLSEYGGRKDAKYDATGFFYVRKINDRYWLIDPDGYPFIHKGVVSVKAGSSKGQTRLLKTKFGSVQKWAKETDDLLLNNGFNGAGNWSDADILCKYNSPVTYTRGFNFMASYGKIRGGTFQQPGHTGYPDDLIFVFDPGFEIFCDREAQQAAGYRDEKRLIGYFSDNEMPFPDNALDRYLRLKKDDPGFKAASKWLSERKGLLSTPDTITDEDRYAFLGFMSDRYFSIVSKALKKYDPNHMYLGCRFHGDIVRKKTVFESAGRYMDIVSVNYYGVWTPAYESLLEWSSWSGRPVLITEWYIKAEDSNMKNESGAGWIVKTQNDRGLFYQNYTLALLESKVCVGWHWFKYQDNDPSDKEADPSNLDANKGIVNNSFIPYSPLLENMKKINTQVYRIIEYFDK